MSMFGYKNNEIVTKSYVEDILIIDSDDKKYNFSTNSATSDLELKKDTTSILKFNSSGITFVAPVNFTGGYLGSTSVFSTLSATTGTIINLINTTATISRINNTNLISTTGIITNLNTTSFIGTTGNITNLRAGLLLNDIGSIIDFFGTNTTSTNIYNTNLTSTTGTITNLNTTSFIGTTGTITNLTSENVIIEDLLTFRTGSGQKILFFENENTSQIEHNTSDITPYNLNVRAGNIDANDTHGVVNLQISTTSTGSWHDCFSAGTNITAYNPFYSTTSTINSLNNTILNSTTGTITTLNCSVGNFTTLNSITQNEILINTTTANIIALTATTGTITNLNNTIMNSTTGTIGNLSTTFLNSITSTSTNLFNTNLISTTGTITNLNNTIMNSTTGIIGNLSTTFYNGITSTITNLVVLNNFECDTNTLKIDSANNRVGIRVSTPSQAIDTSGIVKADGGYMIGSNVIADASGITSPSGNFTNLVSTTSTPTNLFNSIMVSTTATIANLNNTIMNSTTGTITALTNTVMNSTTGTITTLNNTTINSSALKGNNLTLQASGSGNATFTKAGNAVIMEYNSNANGTFNFRTNSVDRIIVGTTQSTITDFLSTTGIITNLNTTSFFGTTGTITNLNNINMNSTTGTITNLTSTVLTATTGVFSNIGLSVINSTTSAITNLFNTVMTSTTGTITNLTSNNETITNNLGIGTTNLSGNRRLKIQSMGATDSFLQMNNGTTFATQLQLGNARGDFYIGNSAGGSIDFYGTLGNTQPMIFSTNNTESMRILGTTTKIGINVAVPTETLDVNGTIKNQNYTLLAKMTSPQTTSASTFHQIAWDTLIAQRGFTFSNNDSTITIPRDGLYLFCYSCQWASNGVGIRSSYISLNSSTNPRYGYEVMGTNLGGVSASSGSAIINCVSGDTLVFIAYQNSGGDLNIATEQMSMSISYLGGKI